MITRRSLLSMLSAGIASVAVSTRLAASELKVVGAEDDPVSVFKLRPGKLCLMTPGGSATLHVSEDGMILQVVLPASLMDAREPADGWMQVKWAEGYNQRVLRQLAGRAG